MRAGSAGGYFATRLAPDRRRSEVWRVLAAWLGRRYVPASGAVLDIGCGYCDFLNHVRAAVRVGIDLWPGSREHAGEGVEVVVGDAAEVLGRMRPGWFDTVLASNVLEHLDREGSDAVLEGVRRVLKAGGRFVVVQPNFRLCWREYFDDYTHRQVFTDRGLADYLAAAGFRVEECRPRFLPFSMRSGLAVFHRLLPLYLALPVRPFAGQMLLVARKPA